MYHCRQSRGTRLAGVALVLLDLRCKKDRTTDYREVSHARVSRAARSPAAGFTLVELLVVVSIIAIVAVLAIPTLSAAQVDRRVFADAGYVSQLFRIARTRAVGRGAAVLVQMSPTQTGGGGRFAMYEAVAPNPTGTGAAYIPSSTCKTPTKWPGN